MEDAAGGGLASGSDLVAEAVRALRRMGVDRPRPLRGAGSTAGPSGRIGTAHAPGRCTLVGEHVDYAGGQVACVAIDLGIAVAARVSADGVWRVTSGAGSAERATPEPGGDVGDRPLAVAVVLAARGVAVPPMELAVAATLPPGAGLASSAALACATAGAICDCLGRRLTARALADVALQSERDVVGIPVGPLDQRAVIEAPRGGVLILDCATGGGEAVPWPWPGAVLVLCDTGAPHDVGGRGYRRRREEVGRGLRRLGAPSCQEVDLRRVEMAGLTGIELRRMRHVVTETQRTRAAVSALGAGDLEGLGAIMSASHASLRDDFEVSTPLLDAAVGAALRTPGCAGARLVGAGFGGSVVALAQRAAAAACAGAMTAAIRSEVGEEGRGRALVLGISGGMADGCPHVIEPG